VAVAINFGLAVSWTIPGIILAVAALIALRLKVDIVWVVLAGAGLSIFIL
jgi:chromate transporter